MLIHLETSGDSDLLLGLEKQVSSCRPLTQLRPLVPWGGGEGILKPLSLNLKQLRKKILKMTPLTGKISTVGQMGG